MSLRDLLVSALVLGSLPVILFRPYVGVLMWTWISLMNPHRLAWGFAREFPFAKLVAGTTLFAAVISRERKRLPLTRETVLLVILTLWMLTTTIFSLEPELAWVQWSKVSKILLVVSVTMVLLTSRERIESFVWMIVISVGFYGVKGGFFTVLTGGGYHVLGPAESFIEDNNHLGLALLMVIPLMRYLQQVSERRWVRWALGASMVLTAIAVLGTQSRGAFLGLSAMLAFLVIRGRHKLTLGTLAILMIPIAFLVMPESWFERMGGIRDYRQDESAMGRINAWKFAINLATNRLLLGGGFECFTQRWFNIYAPDPENFHDAHSVYFEVLGEQGFIGLFLFLALGVLVWRTCSWMISHGERVDSATWGSDLARMLQIGLFGYAVSGAFVGLAYFDLYYNFIAIAVAAKLTLFQSQLELPRAVSEASGVLPRPRLRSVAR